MAGSRAPSEVHVVETTKITHTEQTGRSRSKWIWAWVALYTLLGILAILIVTKWIINEGGLDWKNEQEPDLMFHYHPLFMIIGFLFLLGHTSLLYRFFPNGNKLALKITHATFQLITYILMIVAVYAVHWEKDKDVANPTLHFSSPHTWFGLTVFILMGLQLIFGFFGFLFPGFKGKHRLRYRRTHKLGGNMIFLLGCTTMLIGIGEMRPEYITNGLALTVGAYMILGTYLLRTDKLKSASPPNQYDDIHEEHTPLLATNIQSGSGTGGYQMITSESLRELKET